MPARGNRVQAMAPDGVSGFCGLTDCYPFSNNIAAMAAYGNKTVAAAQMH
jgi:hypothetical protein